MQYCAQNDGVFHIELMIVCIYFHMRNCLKLQNVDLLNIERPVDVSNHAITRGHLGKLTTSDNGAML